MDAETSREPNVYILHGDDDFALAAAVKSLSDQMGEPGMAEMNTARLDARVASDEVMRTAANSPPFLCAHRLVIVWHALARFGSAGAQGRYQPFLEKIPATTQIVLVIPDIQERGKWKLLPETHWLTKWRQQAGDRVKYQVCTLPPLKEMPKWINNQARSLGGVFTQAAAVALTAHVANNTRLANLEIEKLLAYANYQRPVEVVDVEMLTVGSGQTSVFEMVDAMAGGNPTAALRMLHKLLEEQEESYLFAMIIRQFRLLVQTRELMDEGASLKSIEKMLIQPEFIIRKLYGQAQRFSMSRLEDIYRRLLEVDEAMKTSSMPAELALDLFIAEVSK
ncbi:MAG TPA: DNA polymerase III subunit delta [Levilinea sp.]|nr:DNA polymerase III subunit delta [Levilinea sp.]